MGNGITSVATVRVSLAGANKASKISTTVWDEKRGPFDILPGSISNYTSIDENLNGKVDSYYLGGSSEWKDVAGLDETERQGIDQRHTRAAEEGWKMYHAFRKALREDTIDNSKMESITCQACNPKSKAQKSKDQIGVDMYTVIRGAYFFDDQGRKIEIDFTKGKGQQGITLRYRQRYDTGDERTFEVSLDRDQILPIRNDLKKLLADDNMAPKRQSLEHLERFFPSTVETFKSLQSKWPAGTP